MIKLRSLSFGDASLAQAALDKLRKGTDFRWMKANAEGQLLSNTEEGASFGEGLVTVRSLPEAVRRALEGAEEGFFVLYREDEKRIHVMNIEKRVPSRVQKFEEVQKGVLQQVYKERVDKALADWTARLKKAYVTKVYAVGFSGSAP